MSHNWIKIEPHFGKLTDREIADKFGIQRGVIANRRNEMGIAVVKKWSRFGHLLGTMLDRDLAELIGCKPNTVTAKRRRMGIPSFFCGPEGALENAFCTTLALPFERQVSTPLGRIDILTPTAIYECKYNLSLNALHKAVGQLICYGSVFPDRRKIIVCAEMNVSSGAVALLESLDIELVHFIAQVPQEPPQNGGGEGAA